VFSLVTEKLAGKMKADGGAGSGSGLYRSFQLSGGLVV